LEGVVNHSEAHGHAE
jgi:hypothetical protein